jgi:pyruvate formate-lyase activating enzyme-like uncharacterized protein
MKLISIQEAFRRRFERQAGIPGLEFHASGHCVHVGKLSPGCYSCFAPNTLRCNFPLGSQCNRNCDYCYGAGGEAPPAMQSWEGRLRKKAALLQGALDPDRHYDAVVISFTGGGEPLLHLDLLQDYMQFYRGIEPRMNIRPWYYLYTNGILADRDMLMRLKEMGFDEIRFHLGASDFAEGVYRNMEEAVNILDTVSVETPAWPPHRGKLFEMLPILDELGVKHLNLGQVEITESNRKRIAEVMPDAEIFQCYTIHLDDHGLAYDIMEEVLQKGYRFSVLDCNAFVKSIQRSPGKHLCHESVKDLCADVSVCGKKSYQKGPSTAFGVQERRTLEAIHHMLRSA